MKKGFSSIFGAIMIALVVVVCILVVQISLKTIQSMPIQYYDLLPASNQIDLDGDQIPDVIDDSDGDGIPDHQDVTPYGQDVDIFEARSQMRWKKH